MESEDKVYAIGFVAVPAAFVALMSLFPLYYSAKNARIAEMVRHGADPIAAACALDGGDSRIASSCATLIAVKRQ